MGGRLLSKMEQALAASGFLGLGAVGSRACGSASSRQAEGFFSLRTRGNFVLSPNCPISPSILSLSQPEGLSLTGCGDGNDHE